MMKKILVLILCVLVYSALFAQSNEDKKTVFQLSFVPPLSTNGAYSHQYTNTVSLNLLVFPKTRRHLPGEVSQTLF